MTEFVEIAQANYQRSKKDKSILTKQLKAEAVIEKSLSIVEKIVIALCTASLIANTVLLTLILVDMLSK